MCPNFHGQDDWEYGVWLRPVPGENPLEVEGLMSMMITFCAEQDRGPYSSRRTNTWLTSGGPCSRTTSLKDHKNSLQGPVPR